MAAPNLPETKPQIPTDPKALKRFSADLDERAKWLIDSGRRLLRKRGGQLPQGARTNLEARLARLVTARKHKKDLAEKLAAADALDAGLDEFLGQYRKSSTQETFEAIAWAIALTLLIRIGLFEAFQIPTGSMIPSLHIHDHLFVNKFLYGIKIPFTRIKVPALRPPARGEIVVFEYPYDDDAASTGRDLIKRVIGVPGDRVRMEHNQLIINGKPVPRKVLADQWVKLDAGGEEYRRHEEAARECLGDYVYTTHNWGDNPDWPTRIPDRNTGPHGLIYLPEQNKDYPDFVVPPAHLLMMGDNRDNSRDGRFFGLVPLNTVKGKASVRWLASHDDGWYPSWYPEFAREWLWWLTPDLSRMFESVYTVPESGSCEQS